MPVADPFTALGRRTGFPFCLPKVDVSLYDYSNPMTLEQASKLFWDLYAVNIAAEKLTIRKQQDDPPSDETVDFATIYDTDPPLGKGEESPVSVTPFKIGTYHAETTKDTPSLTNTSDYTAVDPKHRVCSGKGAYRSVRHPDGTLEVLAGLGFFSFAKLYNGDTTDEANHVGYGFPMGAMTMAAGITGLEVDQCSLGNYASLTDWSDPSGFYLSWWDEQAIWYGDALAGVDPDTVTNVTVDGIPFVQVEWTGSDSNYTGGGTTMTFTVTPPTDGFFEFYTYD